MGIYWKRYEFANRIINVLLIPDCWNHEDELITTKTKIVGLNI